MNLCPLPPELRSLVGMDKEGIQIGHLDRGYLPHPTSTMRKAIQDWSTRRADRSESGYINDNATIYMELGNELDKNYDYDRLLSASTGNSGPSGIIPGKIYFLFVGQLVEPGSLGGL